MRTSASGRTSAKPPCELCEKLLRENDLPLPGDWRVKQANDNPRPRILLHGPDKEVRVFLLNHLCFKLLAKRRFPILAILLFPASVCFPNLPAGAHHAVAVALRIITGELVTKPVWDFLKFLGWPL